MLRKNMLTILAVVLFVTQVCCYGGPIIYVDKDATNGCNNGTSWIDAYTDLQDALGDANSAEKPVEIRVAQGMYRPDRSSTEPNGTGDRTATFQLINDVTLKGGYAGPRMSLSGADPNARDINFYETVLSGDLNGDDIEVSDPCYLLTEPTRAENGYHVVTGSGTDEMAILDGFTITAGNANVFEDVNDSGGGMYNAYGSPIITNCTFRGNSAGQGGGMYNNEYGNPTLTNCIFSGNSAAGQWTGGGGMSNRWCRPMLTNCTFNGNSATYEGGGMRNVFSSPTMTKCRFYANTAGPGGAISSYYASGLTMTNCIFSQNNAGQGGGALLNDEVTSTVTNCLISKNSAGSGGAIYNVMSSVCLTNCTFSENSASYGSTIFGNIECHIALANCILWSNQATYPGYIYLTDDHGLSTSPISYCDIKGGKVSVFIRTGYDLHWGPGNIDANPLFADPNNGDYHLKSQAGRWDANSASWVKDDVTSPCIDAGDPASPIGLEPFPNGGIINMGAYGGTAEASKSYFGEPVCETIIAGDINGDCKVNFVDFTFMALHWLEER